MSSSRLICCFYAPAQISSLHLCTSSLLHHSMGTGISSFSISPSSIALRHKYSYQCTFETFALVGYSRDDAERIMRKSVKLAHEARHRFWQEQDAEGKARSDVKIALSLGPFGATLSPAQEFDGFYPPPYGPRGYTSHPAETNTNAFPDTDEGRRLASASADVLAEFHLERLRVFADDREMWDIVDLVAFETVPLSREITAIRRAVGQLQEELRVRHAVMKKWWMSTVWPDGRFPEELVSGGGRALPGQVVQSLLGHTDSSAIPQPWGIGINCTSLEHLPMLFAEFSAAARELCPPSSEKPWLVVYPNRGDTYDPIHRIWIHGAIGKGELWAEKYWRVVKEMGGEDRVWSGIVLGGCCRTGPVEIEALAKRVRE